MSGHTLRDAVVAVIGASGALGSIISRELAERGAKVLLVGRSEEKLRAVGLHDATIVEADLTDANAGDAIVEAATRAHGRLDGVINAAGVVAFGPLTATDDAVIEELFMTNVIGPLWMMRRVTPLLQESRGFIANVSAIVADKPMAGMATYSATKAALTAADHAMGRELRKAGVDVYDIRPPHTETGLVSRALAGDAPKLPEGLAPEVTARRIVDAIEAGQFDVPAEDFSA
ncbi:MAG: SDR family NAD(P)-dependent oxidoreductase [Arachnia sp.]